MYLKYWGTINKWETDKEGQRTAVRQRYWHPCYTKSVEEYIAWWKGVYPFTERSKSFVYSENEDYLDIFYMLTTED